MCNLIVGTHKPHQHARLAVRYRILQAHEAHTHAAMCNIIVGTRLINVHVWLSGTEPCKRTRPMHMHPCASTLRACGSHAHFGCLGPHFARASHCACAPVCIFLPAGMSLWQGHARTSPAWHHAPPGSTRGGLRVVGVHGTCSAKNNFHPRAMFCVHTVWEVCQRAHMCTKARIQTHTRAPHAHMLTHACARTHLRRCSTSMSATSGSGSTGPLTPAAPAFASWGCERRECKDQMSVSSKRTAGGCHNINSIHTDTT